MTTLKHIYKPVIINKLRTQYLRLPGASALLSWFGVSVFTLALALRIWSSHTLGNYFSIYATIFEQHELIIKGPYRYCRHPAYLGSILQIIGLTLAFQSAAGLIFLLIFTPLVFWRIRDEERLLIDAFRENYVIYQQRVPKLFPLRGALIFRRISFDRSFNF